MSSPKIKIRCPNCLKDGSARAELLNRRVSCKHCSHVFRAIPAGAEEVNPAVPATTGHSAPEAPRSSSIPEVRGDERIEAIEIEILPVRDPASAGQPASVEAEALRIRLNQTLERLQEAESVEASLRQEIGHLREELDQTVSPTADPAMVERLQEEIRSLRDELDNARAAIEAESQSSLEKTASLSTLMAEHSRALAAKEEKHARALGSLNEQLGRVKADAQAVEARRLTNDATRTDAENRQANSYWMLDDELEHTKALLLEALEARDRFSRELDSLKANVEDTNRFAEDWNYPGTELEIPLAVADPGPAIAMDEPEPLTVFDFGEPPCSQTVEKLQHPPDLSPGNEREDRIEAWKIAVEQGRVEIEELRRELEHARESAEAASRSNSELTARIRTLETADDRKPIAPAWLDPAEIEAERRVAVDQAVKGAWADFERRLAETQAKLKAANSRADLMEIEAREAREQIAARERDHDFGDGSSFEEGASMTSIRILSDRGSPRLTLGAAEARLALAKQLAVDRKDKSLIDRITKMAERVRSDLESRNYTLAETLVRGAEIETGLDPGGFSIKGLRIFRPSPTIVASLNALAPAFDRVMREGELATIRSTIEEMRTILGDQAGLPEIRRMGRTPATKRPIAEVEAIKLFVAALEGEGWLVRPILTKKPLPDTSLTTYAALIEGCCLVRKSAEVHDSGNIPFLDGVIQASCAMLTRRQQVDGHFSFLDPRGKASKASTTVDSMVAQRPDAIKDGWVIDVDPVGIAQSETGACGVALLSAGKALGRADLTQAAQRAADWATGQPCLPNFIANAASISLLAPAYLDSRQDKPLRGLAKKLNLGLLPGQVENGRWIDAASATIPGHLLILRALHDGWEAIPPDRDDLRRRLISSMELAMDSLLAECKTLGVPAQGNALRDLVRHRGLFPTDADPRLSAAILDSATVIQELCHEGPKPKLGVAADQLAALVQA